MRGEVADFRYQASQFLLQFFESVDLDKLQKKSREKVGNGIGVGGRAPAAFNPMRRRLEKL